SAPSNSPASNIACTAPGRRGLEQFSSHTGRSLNKAFTASRAIPFYTNGMRIGLLGGSFNPPHAAHRAISLFALKRLRLDRVWWMVTPGNPLKDANGLRDLNQRAEAARQIANDPRIDVSCLESVIGTRYTIDTITY